MDAHLSEHLEDEPKSEEHVEQLPPKPPFRKDAIEIANVSNDWVILSDSTKYSLEETLSKADMHLRASGYTVHAQGSTLQAVDRNVSWSFIVLVVVLVLSIIGALFLSLYGSLLVLFLLSIYLIAWFTKKQNRIVITVTVGQFAIQYDGRKALRDAEQLSNFLRE